MAMARPPRPAQAASLGVPPRYVPSLQRIVAPAGGGVLAAAAVVMAAGVAPTRPTAGGGVRCGSTASRPRWLEQAATAAGGTMKVPSLHCATALAGGARATALAAGRVESSGRPIGDGAGRRAGVTEAGLTAVADGAPARGGATDAGGGGSVGARVPTGAGGGGFDGAWAASGRAAAQRASASASPAVPAAFERARRVAANGREVVMATP